MAPPPGPAPVPVTVLRPHARSQPPPAPSPPNRPAIAPERERPQDKTPAEPIRLLGDEISNILRGMCRRGGFAGAVVADAAGLPLADFNCHVDTEAVSACSWISQMGTKASIPAHTPTIKPNNDLFQNRF